MISIDLLCAFFHPMIYYDILNFQRDPYLFQASHRMAAGPHLPSSAGTPFSKLSKVLLRCEPLDENKGRFRHLMENHRKTIGKPLEIGDLVGLIVV